MKITALATIAGLGACGGGGYPPPVHTGSVAIHDAETVAPPSERALEVAREIRRLYRRCDEIHEDLEEDVEDADRSVARQTLAAVIVGLIGELADGDSSEGYLDGTGGQDPCPGDPASRSPCTSRTLFNTDPEAVQQNPAAARQADARTSAREWVGEINHAIEELEEFVTRNPGPENWSAEQEAEWELRRSRLESVCVN